MIFRFILYGFYLFFMIINRNRWTVNRFNYIFFSVCLPVIICEIGIYVYDKLVIKYRKIEKDCILKYLAKYLNEEQFKKFILSYENDSKKNSKKFYKYTVDWLKLNEPSFEIDTYLNKKILFSEINKKYNCFLNEFEAINKFSLKEGFSLFYILFFFFSMIFFYFLDQNIFLLIDVICNIIFLIISIYIKNKKLSYHFNNLILCVFTIISTLLIIIMGVDINSLSLLYVFVKNLVSLIFIFIPVTEVYRNRIEFNSLEVGVKMYCFVLKHRNLVLWATIIFVIVNNIFCFAIIYMRYNDIFYNIGGLPLKSLFEMALYDSTLNYFTGTTIYLNRSGISNISNLLQIILSFITNTVILTKFIEFLYNDKHKNYQ